MAALIAWTVLFAGVLVGAFLSAIGPGGVYMGVEPPQDRGGLTLPKLDRQAHPGCVRQLPDGVIPSRMVVVDSSRTELVLPTARAWARNTNAERADDVWVIGVCR